jgi:hypothetical protein
MHCPAFTSFVGHSRARGPSELGLQVDPPAPPVRRADRPGTSRTMELGRWERTMMRAAGASYRVCFDNNPSQPN